jgi:hypothetical protein
MQINQVSEEYAERRREMQINPGQLQKYIGICRICRYPRDALGDPGRHRQTQTDTDRLRQTRKTPNNAEIQKGPKSLEKYGKYEKSGEV